MGPAILVLSWFLAVTSRADPCAPLARVDVVEGREQEDGEVVGADGARFPPGCSWKTRGCAGSPRPCLWKCCQREQAMNASGTCVPFNSTGLPPLAGVDYTLLVGNPCRFERYSLEPSDVFYLSENLSLVVMMVDSSEEVDFESPAGTFCIERFVTEDGTTTLPVICLSEDEHEDTERQDVEAMNALVYSVGMAVSLPFLVATVAVYVAVPELNNLHGRCLVNHVSSLIVGYVFLIVVKLLGTHVLSHTLCIVSAMIIYFFFLAVFFWLNIMCFDIWWTFSGYRAVVGPKNLSERRQFRLYSLYGWGVPLFMLCTCVINDYLPGLPDFVIRPMIGYERCWFEGRISLLVYFYGPIGILIAANVLMFLLTSLRILRIRRETAILSVPDNRRSDQNRQNTQRFVLYLKLFVVMGMSWSSEPISWLVGGPAYFWWLTDLINALKGVFIFFIFVWKEKIRGLVLTRFKFGTARRFSATTN